MFETGLVRLCRQLGTLVTSGRNNPFNLNEPDRLWVVLKGSVDVFFYRRALLGAMESKHFLFRLEEGQALFGVPALEGIGLQVIPQPGTRVGTLLRSDMKEAMENEAFLQEFSRYLEDWLGNFVSTVYQNHVPHEAEPVVTGQVVEGGEGACINTDRHALWCELHEGIVCQSDLLRTTSGSFGDVIVLLPQCRIERIGHCKLEMLSTEALIHGLPHWFEILAETHRQIIENLAFRVRRDLEIEDSRQRAREEAKRKKLSYFILNLASILNRDPPAKKLLLNDPLQFACRTVSEAAGLSFKLDVANDNQDKPIKVRLKEILEHSQIQSREVVLKGDWWKHDCGPVLGFWGRTDQPVALIPTGNGGYHAVGSEGMVPVNPYSVELLSPYGYTFYRSFDQGPLKIMDLLQFGLRGWKKDFITTLIMGVLGGLVALIPPIVMGLLFDKVLPFAGTQHLLMLILALLVSGFAGAAFQVTRSIAFLRVEIKLDIHTQAALWERLLKLPAPFFRKFTAGGLAVRANSIHAMRRILSGAKINFILGGMFSVFSVVLLFVYSPTMALWALVIIGVTLSLNLWIKLIQVRLQRGITHLDSKLSGMVLQFVTGIAKLRVANAERDAFSNWSREFHEKKRLEFKVKSLENGLNVLNSAVPITATMVFFLLAVQILKGSVEPMTLGDFLAFHAAFGILLAGILGLANSLVSVLELLPLYENLKPILETSPEVNIHKTDPGPLRGEIEGEHVTFRYQNSGTAVLPDISFKVKPNEFVAIVGPAGAGKSTFLRLLLGFESPESGSLFFDRQDISNLDLHAVRRQIGTVLQESSLMQGDLLSFITGSAMVSEEEVKEAVAMAGLERDIRMMPMGLHTVISFNGETLSGGQKQRLLLARAFVKKPRLLFLDEPTSALDDETQEIVVESLARFPATRIVVTKRLELIKRADRILVFNNGQIVEHGTYEALMAFGGFFAELAARKFAY